jgi:hypothetical protein
VTEFGKLLFETKFALFLLLPEFFDAGPDLGIVGEGGGVRGGRPVSGKLVALRLGVSVCEEASEKLAAMLAKLSHR